MLTKIEKRILKFVSKMPATEYVTASSIAEALSPVSIEDVCGACAKLKDGGYIDELICTGGNEYFVHLSFNGRHYAEISRIEIKSFLVRSILTPILVSAATALVTLWLRSIL